MEKKLNKNQTAFFTEALKVFGNASKAMRLSDLKKFADTHGLLVPVSFLNNFCKTSNRGVYDITQCGLNVDEEKDSGLFLIDEDEENQQAQSNDNEDDDMPVEEPRVSQVIIDRSAYVEQQADEIKKVPEIFRTRTPLKKTFVRPVYVVMNAEHDVRCVCSTPKKAYEMTEYILHGTKSLTEQQAIEALDKYGMCVIRCINASSLKSIILKMEMDSIG